jgi:hypothetical protein
VRGMVARKIVIAVLGGASIYVILAYGVLPTFWTVHERHVPAADRVMVTATPEGIPGDPINVGLIGTKEEVLCAFAEAAWNPADPVTLGSAIEIGLSVALDRPYKDAPISTLIYENRKQDLAFEKQAGTSADTRHHVRLWMTAEVAADGRPFWLGSTSFDRGVGISHDTGEVTHHIAPDIDAERDYVVDNLDKAGAVADSYEIDGCGATWEGRNGGGDLYFTDGMARIAILKTGG